MGNTVEVIIACMSGVKERRKKMAEASFTVVSTVELSYMLLRIKGYSILLW